jgi:RNA polymerase sigma-70 factor (ECF subfamily)
MLENNDLQSVREFLRGKEMSLDVLLKKYLKPIYNFLFQIVRERSILDDLTQETFIKVWKNLSHFDQAKSFKTWIFTVAKNTAFDYLRKKKTIPFSFFLNEDDHNYLENIQSLEILPNEILEKKDISKELEQKLKKLSPDYRLILILHYQNDFSLKEIAEMLNKPYNTIKSGHNRAIKALKHEFDASKLPDRT